MLVKLLIICSILLHLVGAKSDYQEKLKRKEKAKNRLQTSTTINPNMFLKPKLPYFWFYKRLLSNKSTVDAEEIISFKNYSKQWWDELGGPVKPLHSFNKLRIPFIREGLVNVGTIDNRTANSPEPFKGFQILDLGCGGGILSEPLSRLGGEVTGLDAASDLIQIAKEHAAKENVRVNYVCQTIEDHAKANSEKYDLIVASEILEHVTEKAEFLDATCKCLKPKGSLFVTTLSKTFLAHVLGIWMAEYFFHLVPKGTHQYEKFIKPQSLQKMLKERGLNTKTIHGMFYNPLKNEWTWFFDQQVAYGLHATKNC